MPVIKCEAVDCIHNDHQCCGVTADTQIDVSKKGECLDYSPVTDDEYQAITGRARTLGATDVFVGPDHGGI